MRYVQELSGGMARDNGDGTRLVLTDESGRAPRRRRTCVASTWRGNEKISTATYPSPEDAMAELSASFCLLCYEESGVGHVCVDRTATP